MHFERCDVAKASHFRGVFLCVFHPHFLQKSITQHLVYTSARANARADKVLRNATAYPTEQPKQPRAGAVAKPLARPRFRSGLSLSGAFVFVIVLQKEHYAIPCYYE